MEENTKNGGDPIEETPEDGNGSEKERKSCKDCPDRFPGCHSGCEAYKAFKAAFEAEKLKRQKERAVTAPVGYRLDEFMDGKVDRPWRVKYY